MLMSTKIKRKIIAPYIHAFEIEKSGLVAISVSARCKSKEQIKSNTDEDLRVEINHAPLRELLPEKNIQQFNIPCAFNGSKLRGLKKTVVFLTVLEKGGHEIILIPNNSAFVEEIQVQSYPGNQNPQIEVNEQAEDGDRRPWHNFVIIDLPLKSGSIKAGVQYYKYDSDDIKLIVDGHVYTREDSRLHKFWLWAGSLLGKTPKRVVVEKEFETHLLPNTHYIEMHADKTPILHDVQLDFSENETNAQVRARRIIKENVGIIKTAAKEFEVDPVMVAGVIHQEQSTNFNFRDKLTDYIGGLAGIDTSIGIGQVKVSTAEELEQKFNKLNPIINDKKVINTRAMRVEFLKDPLMNVRYVATKIKFDQDRWRDAGFDISSKPEILATLYNIDSVKEPEKKPHINPDSNDFGKGVALNYNIIKGWLKI
ncbi:MAG: hypothetical protein COV79_05380 [Parcubacteria group bacterium CG11_big_fil_rev_8_21_14_0_20_41_14]|nr:MAG: hypothetical protein COW93_00280 [Parcubacteria group bacterium CG22_combo_CG10-13_8_21_14_all_41_9]PIQ78338.1 MAG: hypothetical protein COV79_05380 [Parcubacteria group bacterium CG11_big_fil_rev_8_21_14_0_20_41_14]PIR57440.1 MAG: hypothetical protein COU72_00940 [Parcubacteria group bacterium CG10_big_fil_rev_8_21_14_0_10_41_35]